MSFQQLKEPFQYEKYPIETLKKHKQRRASNTWGTIKRISGYLFKYKWLLFLVILMVIISSSMALAGPYLVGMAIDDFIVAKRAAVLYLIDDLAIDYIYYSFCFRFPAAILDDRHRSENCFQFKKGTIPAISSITNRFL